MRLERAIIKNFRLLENVDITFEPVSTVVDGCLNPPEFGEMGSAAVAGSD
jgi:hypothetical protein